MQISYTKLAEVLDVAEARAESINPTQAYFFISRTSTEVCPEFDLHTAAHADMVTKTASAEQVKEFIRVVRCELLIRGLPF